jgi:hypothetical protein
MFVDQAGYLFKDPTNIRDPRDLDRFRTLKLEDVASETTSGSRWLVGMGYPLHGLENISGIAWDFGIPGLVNIQKTMERSIHI